MMSLLAVAVVGVLAIAGCGGGGSSSSGSSSGSAESSGGGGDFAAGAEAACTKANKAIIALGTPQQEQVTQYIESTEAAIETLHQEVAALDASGPQTAYVEGLAQAIPVLTKMSNAARNENFDAVRELSAGLVEIHLGELAEAAELKACAEVPVSES
jgi:hypothetical protein